MPQHPQARAPPSKGPRDFERVGGDRNQWLLALRIYRCLLG